MELSNNWPLKSELEILGYEINLNHIFSSVSHVIVRCS